MCVFLSPFFYCTPLRCTNRRDRSRRTKFFSPSLEGSRNICGKQTKKVSEIEKKFPNKDKNKEREHVNTEENLCLPVRENELRLERIGNNRIRVNFPDYRGRLVLRIFYDGKYSHKLVIRTKNGFCYLDNINNVSNVRVKLCRRRKVLVVSKTLSMKANSENKSPRMNETVTGYLSAYNPWKLYSFTITQAVTVLLKADSDYDLYANWDNTYNWQFRSETYSGNETLDIPKPATARTLYVLVYRYSGEGSYSLQLQEKSHDIVWSETSTKKALLSGISDYLDISDLDYCDEDVVDWYNYLTTQGYECRVLGDSKPMNFPRFDGIATKNNMRKSVQTLASTAKEGDTIAFITSGHGHGNGIGDSYLCTYDGLAYNDTELHKDLEVFSGNKIVIIDHCFSGGFADNLVDLPNIFFGATCSKSGYGYDMSLYENGAFTYAWHEILQTSEPDTLINLFNKVKSIYSGSDDLIDQPMYICTNANMTF